jgi:hypothetical protein
MVKEEMAGIMVIVAHRTRPKRKKKPTFFLDVLKEWGNMWMWENLTWTGYDGWNKEAIQQGTCMAVMDGSYMEELYPNIQSSAIILEYQNGPGRMWCSFFGASNAA